MLFKEIFEENNFTPTEQEFVRNACDTDHIASLNRAKIIAELILSRRISESTDKLIVSNDKHSQRMLWLTGALVFVGVVQIVAQITQIYQN